MRWADSELLLGQPVRFNLAPSRVPEDHVDIEDFLKDSAGPLSPSEEFIIDNPEDLLGRAFVGAFTLVRHCLCQAGNESKGGMLIFFRLKTYAGSWSGKDKLNFLLRILKRIAVRIPLETSLHSPLLTKSIQSNSFALISAQVLPILLNHHHMAHELRVISPGLNFALSQRCRQIDNALVR